ncbi:MAG: DUF3313 domain-containing protein [Syntrophorhabdaceae bacterium]|nr:DUF3313 domain-containing protein [Syntrophorhabdaceae bacterium]
MTKTVHITLAVVIGITLAIAAGFAAEPKYSGFLGDSYRLLEPGPEGGAKMRWLKPGVDFGKYKKFMVDSVVFFFADDSEYKGIDPQEMKELADSFNRQIVAALKDKYPIVAEPGPDVARIRFAITGFKQSRPVLSGVTSIVPVGLAVSLVKKGTTGSWTGSGATSAELMVLDSTTNDVIALAADDRAAGFTERFSKWGSADEAFKFWAERLRTFMDNVQTSRKQ